MSDVTTELLKLMKGSKLVLPKFITELDLRMSFDNLPQISITYYPTHEEAHTLFNTLTEYKGRWKVISPSISTPRQPP